MFVNVFILLIKSEFYGPKINGNSLKHIDTSNMSLSKIWLHKLVLRF